MIATEFETIASAALPLAAPVPVVAAVRPSLYGPLVEWRAVPDGAEDLLRVLARTLAYRWRQGTPRIPLDWQETLRAQYPGVFDDGGPRTFGGWRWLWEAGASLGTEEGVVIRTSQTKEKFGSMRWYAGVERGTHRAAGERAMRVIGCVEALSAHSCEFCGSPGKLRPGGWAKTACDYHAKRGNRRDPR